MIKPKKVDSVDADTVEITVVCPRCGRESKIRIPLAGFCDYFGGSHTHVQDVFPGLEPELRELMVSGLCITCQEEIFY